jgi:hypothetical protein
MPGGEPVADDLDIMKVMHIGSVEADKAFVHEILCILLGSLAVKSGKGSVVALNHDTGFDKLNQLVV